MKPTAFAPSHLTLIFQASPSAEPRQAGSRGVGVNIAHGVECSLAEQATAGGSIETYFNGQKFKGTITTAVLSQFQQMGYTYNGSVHYSSDLPIGAGFGTSAASALALATVLNEHLGAGLTEVQVADIAHIADITLHTGLGDVSGSMVSGVEWRKKAGSPSQGEVVQLQRATDEIGDQTLYIASNGAVLTSQILSSSRMNVINNVGSQLLDQVFLDIGLNQLFNMAYEFHTQVNLLSEMMRNVLSQLRRTTNLATAVMIGDTILSVGHRPPGKFKHVIETHLDTRGVRMLDSI